jgi:peptidoglycan/LPS O-acetylase OafA/YrhL
MDKSDNRIQLLDGFRAIAIISVILFHFFSRYIPSPDSSSLYPYTDKYNFFGYGFMGVQFFFLISGFVIFFTLERTDHFSSFWKKRIIRLLPSMIVASILTFIVFRLFDDKSIFPESHEVANFLPSFTFLHPALLNFLIHPKNQFYYLNGSYWSLWPEIQFYLFVSVLFYMNKRKFVRNFSFISIFLICFNHLAKNVLKNNALHIHLPHSVLIFSSNLFQLFNLFYFLPFFSAGMLFYLLYKNNNENTYIVRISLSFLILYLIYIASGIEERLIYLAMLALFFFFIYYPKKLSFLNNSLISRIGISSYFLYLIHEHIGVLMINKLAKYFMPVGFIFTILLICLLISFSIMFSEQIEKRVSYFLKKRLLEIEPYSSSNQPSR